MLNDSAERTNLVTVEQIETTPDWSSLEQSVEDLLEVLGTSLTPQNNESSEHLSNLENFDWAKASQQGSSILRRR